MCLSLDRDDAALPASLSRPVVSVTSAKAVFRPTEVTILYELVVEFQGRSWKLDRGFSDVRHMRHLLKGRVRSSLPRLPSCGSYSRTNSSWSRVSARRAALDDFFARLSRSDSYFEDGGGAVLDDFLDVPRNLGENDLVERAPPPQRCHTTWWCQKEDAVAYLRDALGAGTPPATPASPAASHISFPESSASSCAGSCATSSAALTSSLSEVSSHLRKLAKRCRDGGAVAAAASASADGRSEAGATSNHNYNSPGSVDELAPKGFTFPADVWLCVPAGSARREKDGIVIQFNTVKGQTTRCEQRQRLYDVAVVYSWVLSFGDRLPSPETVTAFTRRYCVDRRQIRASPQLRPVTTTHWEFRDAARPLAAPGTRDGCSSPKPLVSSLKSSLRSSGPLSASSSAGLRSASAYTLEIVVTPPVSPSHTLAGSAGAAPGGVAAGCVGERTIAVAPSSPSRQLVF